MGVIHGSGIDNSPYGPGWDGSQFAPTQDAVYDIIQTIIVGGGFVTDGANLGDGEEVFAQNNAGVLEFRTLVAGSGISLSSTADEITITNDSPGEVNTASNLGSGEGWFSAKVGVDLQFKSAVAGHGIDLSSTPDEVTIDVDESELDASLLGNFAEAVDDRVASLLVAGHGIDLTYNDVGGSLTIDVDETELNINLMGGAPLSLANGGTNKAITAVAGAVVWTDADSMELTAAGSTGQILRSAGTSSPTWTTATFASTYAQGDLLHASAANTVAGLTIGANNTILRSNGTIPVWSAASTIAALIDHGLLIGLGDDDHTQYLLLAGRSGGQTAIGGTANGNDLTLRSTSGGTKGKIIFGLAGTTAYMETVERFGVGISTPVGRMHLNNAGISNEVALFVTAHASQTANLMTFSASGGATLAHMTDDGLMAVGLGSPSDVSLQFEGDPNTGLNWDSADIFSAVCKAITMQTWDATNGLIEINPAFQGFDTYIHSANDSIGTFYVSGGGDSIWMGLGETPTVVGSPSKLNIQVGGIRDNYGAISTTHLPTASTGSIIPPDFRMDFLFDQAAAAVKTLTRSQFEQTYNPTTSNAGATLNLGTSSNKAMHMLTFSPSQTAGTLVYPAFRFQQFQRNVNGAGIAEEWDVNQTGSNRNRFCGYLAIAFGAGVPDLGTVAWGGNYVQPDANYSVWLTGTRTAYTVQNLAKAVVGAGWLHVKVVLDDSTKATTGFTAYLEYEAFDAVTLASFGSWNNLAIANAAITANYAGGVGPPIYADTDYTKISYGMRRYYV